MNGMYPNTDTQVRQRRKDYRVVGTLTALTAGLFERGMSDAIWHADRECHSPHGAIMLLSFP
jgi:hypothetical protein